MENQFSNLKFHTPPENQGQIIELSYARDIDCIFCCSHDKSDNTKKYFVADLDWAPNDIKWDEYEIYHPINGKPPWELAWVHLKSPAS